MLAWLEDGRLDPYQKPANPFQAYALFAKEPSPVQQAGQIMSRPVITIDEFTSVDKALGRMSEHGLHHLGVIRLGRLVGLVSDRDLMRAPPEAPAASFMTSRLLTARPETSLWKVARTMVRHRVHSVPVLDSEGQLVGLVTSQDLLALMTHQAPVEVWL
ncbi:MAG: HPP family protein [Vulcanimicrobiota bacterium]